MNFVDIGVFLLILLFAIVGWKRGVIKSIVKLVGLVIVAIIAYQLKTPLANFLIDILPFYNFGGSYEDLFGINILFYHAISFMFIFIMLFAILNIVVNLAGILDKIMKATIILYLPNKILGALVGVIEGVIVSFILIFIAAQIPQAQEYVLDSMYANQILQRTPVIRTVLANGTITTTEINEAVKNYDEEDKTDLQIDILSIMINYKIISAEDVEKLIEDNKINLPNVEFD